MAGQAVTTLDAGELRRFADACAALHRRDGIRGSPQDLQNRYGPWELDRRRGASNANEPARRHVRGEGRILHDLAMLQSIEVCIDGAGSGASGQFTVHKWQRFLRASDRLGSMSHRGTAGDTSPAEFERRPF